jgi:hypothetical protein
MLIVAFDPVSSKVAIIADNRCVKDDIMKTTDGNVAGGRDGRTAVWNGSWRRGWTF